MSVKRYVNLFILSFAFMLVFTAFQTTGLISKAILDSTGIEISSYISLGILYAVFAIFNWVAPPVISLIGPRISIIIGAITYLIYITSYFHPRPWLLYTVSGVVGAGAGIIWTAQGFYMTMNAGKENMTAHSGIFWAILQCSLLIGNTFIYVSYQGKDKIDESTRHLTFVVLSTICAGGVFLFILLRRAARSDTEELSDKPSATPLRAFVNAFKLFATREMILFSITFVYTGIELTFWSGVYGSAVGATTLLPNSKSLIGLTGIFIGIGEILGGLVFGIFGKRVVKRGRSPVVGFGLCLHLTAFALIFINMPNAASAGDTSDTSIIHPNVYIAMLCSFLLGLADAMYNTQIYAAIGIIYGEQSVSGFAIFKFTQSVGAAIAFFYTNFIGLHYQLLILVITSIIGTTTYIMAELLVKKNQEKIDID